MKNEVTIEIITTQTVDGQRDESKVSYCGSCQIADEVATLVYAMEQAGQRVETTLTLKELGCVMENHGAEERIMDFRPGQRTQTSLQLPMGRLDLGVHTHTYQLETTREEAGCMQVELVYDLLSGEDLLANNRLQIRVTPSSH